MVINYEIRIFNERFCMDPKYYCGNDDIYLLCFADTKERLIEEWHNLIKAYEGETYAVRDIQNCALIIGGAFDPDDIDAIKAYFEQRRIYAQYLLC